MKTKNFSYRNYKQIKSEAEAIIMQEKGITKALLEKYKPKVLYNLETLSERKVKMKVA